MGEVYSHRRPPAKGRSALRIWPLVPGARCGKLMQTTEEEPMTAPKRWAALLFSSLALAAAAQAPYPNKPIKWIVPYTPGGITDSVTRFITQKLSESLGQPVVI